MYRCKQPPEGCGKVITSFLTEVALDQFKITGLCESCQLAKARPATVPHVKQESVELHDAGPTPTDD